MNDDEMQQTINEQMQILVDSADSLELKAREWVILDIENIAVGRLFITVRETGIDSETGKMRYGLFKGDSCFNFVYPHFPFYSIMNSSRNDLFYKHHRVYSKEECLEALKKFMKENPNYFNRWEPRESIETSSYRWE